MLRPTFPLGQPIVARLRVYRVDARVGFTVAASAFSAPAHTSPTEGRTFSNPDNAPKYLD
jgi:hypothetical protein